MAPVMATERLSVSSAAGRAAHGVDFSSTLLKTYILGLPIWWLLGIDFIMPVLLSVALVLGSPAAHRQFAFQDYLLAALVTVFMASAYLNGFLLAQESMRFLAALYNAANWACGLILVQQVRAVLHRSGAGRRIILQSGFRAFMALAAIAWGSFILAYAIDRFELRMPSLFGLLVGDNIPDSAILIKQSISAVFTKPDWGLPGIPMPRLGIYGPYPNATAAVIAVLGTLALLHLCGRGGRHRAMIGLTIEGLIVITLAITLSRSILAGWLFGALAANVIFGTAWRRIICSLLIAGATALPIVTDISDIAEYRQYSTESRVDNYVRALEQTAMTSPIIGLGIKPREAGRHIAVGSHSTFVSSFTKGGSLALGLAFAYLVIHPALRWLTISAGQTGLRQGAKAELRILFRLQVTIWTWLAFEDIDAPATAAMLLFLAFALIESVSQLARTRDGDFANSTRFSG